MSLSTNSWCGMFTGAITNWNDAAITADNQGTQLGSGPITIIYRNDRNGTTFLFSNALIKQCAATSHPVPAGWQSAPGNTTGAGNDLFFVNVKNASLLPANFVAATGGTGVQSAISATVGATGYLTPDLVAPIASSGPKAANLQIFATVHGVAQFAVPYPPIAAATMNPVKPPSFLATCQTQKQGCASNPLAWGATAPGPTASNAYPIGGFYFVELYSCYNSATDVDALVGTRLNNLGLFRWYFGTSTENRASVRNTLWADGFGLPPNAWIVAAKKLLTTNTPTAVGTPGQAATACAGVVGHGA